MSKQTHGDCYEQYLEIVSLKKPMKEKKRLLKESVCRGCYSVLVKNLKG